MPASRRRPSTSLATAAGRCTTRRSQASVVTGAPLAVRNRARGTVDDYAAAVGRWLVTRDGFDFLAYYLSDVDYLSHLHGPDGTREAIERTDLALAALVRAAGGPDEFLERYAVVLCSDHAQTRVDEAVRLQEPLRDVEGVVVTASNRAGMVYRLDDCPLDVSELASIVGRHPAIEAVSFLEEEEAVV